MGRSTKKKIQTIQRKAKKKIHKAAEFTEDVGEVMQDTSNYVIKAGKAARAAGLAGEAAAGVVVATGNAPLAGTIAVGSAGAVLAGQFGVTAGGISKGLGYGLEQTSAAVAHYTDPQRGTVTLK